MSYKYQQFTVKITLQHISMIKIVQHLWKQLDVVAEVKRLLNDVQCNLDVPWDSLECASKKVTDHIVAKKLDVLVLPEIIKSDLVHYVIGMGRKMFRWLRDILKDMIDNHNDDYRIKMSFFIENMVWNNCGCIDGEKILKKYARNQGIIDNATWNQLCVYCSEDYIKKYSKTIDWSNYNGITSTFSVFWYHKIHGKFPTKTMFSSLVKRMKFVFEYNQGRYERESIIGTLLVESIIEGNIFAVKYFWKQLSDDDKHQLIFTRLQSIFIQCDKDYSEVYVYLLAEMQVEDLKYFLEKNFRITEVMFLSDWPWILCIHSWRHFFKFCRGQTVIFWRILLTTLKNMKYKMKEFGKGKYRRGILYNKYYQFFNQLWEVHPEVLYLEDIRLFEMMFSEDDEKRNREVGKLKDFLNVSQLTGLNGDFLREFINEVLADDDDISC